MSQSVQYARAFWEAGIHVFPLNSFTGTKCGCGDENCQAPGKHPRARNWQHTPLWDEEQMDNIEEAGWFSSGYGVLCKGLLVIDVDVRNGGEESYSRLVEKIPAIASAGLIVRSGRGDGGRHLYFSLPEPIAMVQHLPEFTGCDFKSSGFVVGPGSRHVVGGIYEAVVGGPEDIEPAPQELIDLLRKPERHRAEYDGGSIDVSHADIADMLAYIPNTGLDYQKFITLGMAIHHATGGTGFELWDTWAAQCPENDSERNAYWFHHFGRSSNPVTIGSIIHYAEQGGWVMPVVFGGGQIDDAVTPDDEGGHDGLPFDISGVDLRKPPGFAGALCDWIEKNSRRPRPWLSVAATITALGNISGLRYTDDLTGVTTNLFTFCVAGSRTGKNWYEDAVKEIHRTVGCAAATHGSIKSEQEIVRNLIRHQASFYVIDEIGIMLQKIKNAQKKGGAAYLDGVIGMLMSAYSKADGFMLLTGDVKEDVRQMLMKELAQINKRIDDDDASDFDRARAEQICGALGKIDNGLEKPFLSLIGFTTPVTFDDLVDKESASNGFIGRSLIFQEPDTAPRSRLDHKKTPMDARMAATLTQIYSGYSCDLTPKTRVEHDGERVAIPTAEAAQKLLRASLIWFEDQAIAHKSKSGLEALYLGADELVRKISLILAVPGGIREVEHVRYAFALVKRDIEAKVRLVIGNENAKDAPLDALVAKILNIVADDGETVGVIKNRLRPRKPDEIEKALDFMLARGLIEKTQGKSIRYRAV